MKRSILNILTQILSYKPNAGITDNPNQRHFDWTRKYYALEVFNPVGDEVEIAPGDSYTIFDGSEANPLDNSSQLNIQTLPQNNPSAYRLSVSSGTSGFRTPRTISNLYKLASVVVQDLTYTAVLPGIAGNSITVAYVGGATAGSEVVSVSGTSVVVQIQSGVSTATQIQTAVTSNAQASALVTVSVSGIGSNPQTASNLTATFTVTSANATIAAVYEDSNDNQFTVSATISGGISLVAVGPNVPVGPSGTLTKVSGSGDVTITYTSLTYVANAISTLSGANYVAVAVNNNAVAVFNFGSATLSGVVVGDTMRISGVSVYDGAGPFAFNPINSGFWTIIGISGTILTAIRPIGVPFAAVQENAAAQSSDVQIYSAAGIQVGDHMAISGTFSEVTQQTYLIQAVTPASIDFVSTAAIPQEGPLSYVSDSIQFYTEAKRFVYLEADQSCAVQFNADTSTNTIIDPIAPNLPGGGQCPPQPGPQEELVGYLNKWGSAYKCVVQNLSVNPLKLKFFTSE